MIVGRHAAYPSLRSGQEAALQSDGVKSKKAVRPSLRSGQETLLQSDGVKTLRTRGILAALEMTGFVAGIQDGF